MDLKVFHDMHVDIIRLDGHFDDFLDRAITHNEYGIKIEFNGSMDSTIDYLLKHGADPHNVTICHNFYPERYSGIGWKLSMNLNEKWKGLGLHTAAFVTSREPNTFGPWPVSAGLPTAEIHRTKPIDVQLRRMLACELIDDILIGNAYASEAELKAMAAVDLSKRQSALNWKRISVRRKRKHCLTIRIPGGRMPATTISAALFRVSFSKKKQYRNG